MVRKIAVAAAPVDLYTGLMIREPLLKLSVEGGPRPYRKKDGWYIIWDDGRPRKIISVESPYYEPLTVEADIAEIWKKRQPSLRICLVPGRSYPFPGEMEWQEGTARAGAVVEGVLSGSRNIIRLTGDYHRDEGDGRTIKVRPVRCLEAEGLPLAIGKKGSREWERLTIWEMEDREKGICRLRAPLNQDYPSEESEIVLCWRTRADEKGNYRLPLLCTIWKK